MEKLDLSTYSKAIKTSYEGVVSGASERYAIFTVDKSSALTASEVQDGEIADFIEEFEDGKVQFGLAKVSAPGSDVKKVVLLGWCPDNAPLKSKVSFGANFGEVAKILKGYHVQITARDQDDLNATDILKTVSDAAGARYSIQSLSSAGSSASSKRPTPKPITPTPTTASKPAAPPKPIAAAKPTPPKPTVSKEDDDEWDGEEETEVRDFSQKPLQNVPSAYKPTKVDIDLLRKGKNDGVSSTPVPATTSAKSEPSKKTEESKAEDIETKIKSFSISGDSEGRLSSLPKPKVSHSVASRFTEVKPTSSPSFGTKPPVPVNLYNKNSEAAVGGLSKNFASQGGKTPAQIWAEKHGKYQEVAKDDEIVKSTTAEDEDYVIVEPALKSEEKEEEKEEDEEEQEEPEEEKSFAPPPPAREEVVPAPPVRRSVPPPPPAAPEPASEPESEPEEPEKPEEPAAPAAPSLPKREATPEDAPALPSRATSEPEKKKTVQATAEYAYLKDEDNEIGFEEGDLIIDIEFVDEDWWSGKHSATGEVGLFPSSYVTIIEEREASPALPSRPTAAAEPEDSGKTATAEYDYDATEDNELTFKEGDVISNIEFIDEDWWLGTLNGTRNLFPANYVTLN